MYTYIELSVSRNLDQQFTEELTQEEYKDYKDIPLMNYTMKKDDLFKTMYHQWYNTFEVMAFIAVPKGQEEEGIAKLKEDVLKSLNDSKALLDKFLSGVNQA